MRIPEKHKRTIRALFEADPEVMQATCDIPHEDPTNYLRENNDMGPLPYCGCFVGVYGWMYAYKRGEEVIFPTWDMPVRLADETSISYGAISDLAVWCITYERDHAAVLYARSLLAAT